MFEAKGIKNIIFDLGGVLFNINYSLTEKAFIKLGIQNFNEIYSQSSQSNIFDAYETGQISSASFRSGLKKFLPKNINDDQIDAAWNAMLLNFPKEHVDLLLDIKKHFNIYLFSNTNEIHINYFRTYLDNVFGLGLFDNLFNKHFYSNELGFRKPDPAAFSKVLELSNLNASETFFIDDSLQHVEGATKAGLKGYYLKVKEGETVRDLFSDYLIS